MGRLDLEDHEFDIETASDLLRVAHRMIGRVATRQRQRAYGARTYGVDGDRRHQRRVHAARKSEDGGAKAVLAKVVARAHHERFVDLLDLARWLRNVVHVQRLGVTFVAGVEGVEHGARRRRARLNLAHEQLLAEGAGASDHLSGGVDDQALTIKDELVLTAHQVHVRDRAVRLAGPIAQHGLALVAPSPGERRRVGDDKQGGTLRREFRRRAALGPHVLADQHAYCNAFDVDDGLGAHSGVEVTKLIEHVVVGQEALGGGRDHTVFTEGHQHVRDMAEFGLVEHRMYDITAVTRRAEHHVGSLARDGADQDRRQVGRQRQFKQGHAGRLDEAFLQQEILRRIPDQREFRCQHEIGTDTGRLIAKTRQSLHVLGESTHDRVHLGEG